MLYIGGVKYGRGANCGFTEDVVVEGLQPAHESCRRNSTENSYRFCARINTYIIQSEAIEEEDRR